MAQVLVTVPDPLLLAQGGDGESELLLDSYVRVLVQGKTIDDVIQIPRTAYREGVSVWVLTAENRLHIRPVNVLWTGEDEVVVANDFEPGERLIVSNLGAPVEGMALTAIGENGTAEPVNVQDSGEAVR